MKGNNILELNEATIVEALQLWCDHKFKTPPKVTSVKQTSTGYSSVFEVHVTEPDESLAAGASQGTSTSARASSAS